MALIAISYPELIVKDREWIQTIRRRYDAHYEWVDPHFTFIFEITDIARGDFINHVRDICRNESKIDFHLKRALVVEGIVDSNWYLFLVPDEGNLEIVSLHDNLYTGILARHLRLDIPYIPHMTVGIFDDEGECKKVSDKLNQEEIMIKGRVSYLDIMTLEDDRLKTIERIKLT
jgi:2'-5' RNA ligase